MSETRRKPVEQWEVGETFSTHNSPTRYWETSIWMDGVGRIATTYGASEEEAKANAEFIVRACNAHDELLAALKSLPLEAFDKPMDAIDAAEFVDHAGEFFEAMGKARGALAKAEGKL